MHLQRIEPMQVDAALAERLHASADTLDMTQMRALQALKLETLREGQSLCKAVHDKCRFLTQSLARTIAKELARRSELGWNLGPGTACWR